MLIPACLNWDIKIAGTFDVQHLTAKLCSQNNSINVSLTYAVGSSALGALIILIPMKSNGSLDLPNTDYRMLQRNNLSDVLLPNISSGNCALLGYDIEEGGMLRIPETFAAVEDNVYDIPGDRSAFLM